MSSIVSRRLAALAAAAALLLTACGQDEADDPAETDTTTGGTESSAPADGSGESAMPLEQVECEYADAGSSAVEGIDTPPTQPAVNDEEEVTMATSAGEFALSLDAVTAPCTVNSFVSLVEQGYFDDTTCHRLTAYEGQGDQDGLSVLQCGDPTGTGTGGPGYTIPDELSGEETYPAGTLAMAKTNLPDSGGSQFFIVYEDSSLPPDYTVFGTVDDATLGAITDIAEAGSNPPTDGAPNTEVRITEAELTS